MLRITLEQDYGERIGLKFGYESVTPIPMGANGVPLVEVDNSLTRAGHRAPSLAQPRIWWLEYANEDERSALVPNEVAVHYFGDWRSGTDPVAEENKQIPKFNNERARVAMAWGDYQYTRRGRYSTTKIAVPRVPHVVIHNVNANGSSVGTWAFRPWDFWRFEELLAADAAEQMAEVNRRGKASSRLNIADIPEDQLDELAALLQKRSKKAVPA
jgi:hypothetical protein